MTARDDDFRSANPVFHRNNVGTEAIAHVVIFDHDPFALWHDRFELAKIENHVGAIEAAHRPAHDFTGAILKFLVNHFLLDLTNALHHRLFRGLRGDPAKISRRYFHLDGVADFCVRLDLLRLAQGNFVLRIPDVINHHEVRECADIASSRINVDAQIARRPDAFFRRREQCVRHCFEQDFAFDPALPLQVIKHGNKFGVHKNI